LVGLPTLPVGLITAKYRSAAIATKVNTEEAAIQGRFPLVIMIFHKTDPAIPSGWVAVIMKKVFGVTKWNFWRLSANE